MEAQSTRVLKGGGQLNILFDIHKKFEFTNTSEIEGMFGVLRTFIRRMYHHTTPEKFPDIMCEFYYRFSHPEIFSSPYEYLLNSLTLGHHGRITPNLIY